MEEISFLCADLLFADFELALDAHDKLSDRLNRDAIRLYREYSDALAE